MRSLDRIVEMRNGRSRPKKGIVLSAAYEDGGNGRARVNLHFRGKGKMKLVHRLVAEAFLGSCPPGMEACHNNGNPSDNRLSNIRWDTHKNNEDDKRRHGTNDRSNRTHCPQGHELTVWNRSKADIRRGRRSCLACNASKYRVNDPRFQEESDRHFERLRSIHQARSAEESELFGSNNTYQIDNNRSLRS